MNPADVPLSLAFYTVPELSPPEVVSVAAEAGCRHVGLRLLGGSPADGPAPLMADAALQRDLKARLTDTGIRPLDANTARLTAWTAAAEFRPFLETAAELGARHVLATGDDPDEARLIAQFAELAQLASALGMTVEIEFVPWLALSDLPAAARVVAAAGMDNLGIAVDALHFDRSGGQPSDIARVPAQRFRYMHMCDAPKEFSADRESLLHVAVRERLFPGEGGIDLVGLLRAMPRQIPLALEIPIAARARSLDATARVRHAVAATHRILERAFGQPAFTGPPRRSPAPL